MNRPRRSLLSLALLLGASMPGWAQTVPLPLEIRQSQTRFNFQSVLGMPLTGNDADAGSDGTLDPGNESTGIFTPPTTGQFQSLISFGGAGGLTRADWEVVKTSAILNAGTTPFSGVVAEQMRRPRATSAGTVIMVLRHGQVGSPYLSRQVSFAFGAVLTPPKVDENGAPLVGIPSTAYWLPEPYSSTDHVDAGYYWSSHARVVYANQPGPVTITWRKAVPYASDSLPTYTNQKGPIGGPDFAVDGANHFLLYTENHIVSGSAVKKPRRMYWTEKGFRNTGVPISVPRGRVGAVNVVYSSSFPKTVAAEYKGVGSSSPADGSGAETLQERRTLWWDQEQSIIAAYNREGRVLLELLGDLRSDGVTYQPLGVEIIDVSKQPSPVDVTIELGERVTPPEGGEIETLFPVPLLQPAGTNFAYRHDVVGSERVEYYATRETQNQNDYLVHWLEESVAALRWPRLYGRYDLVWPSDAAKYSHYVRPLAANDDEAALTAVVLDSQNVPFIEYQDSFDRPRAKFTPEFKFYTILDAAHPVHRTLLRFVSGENIAFERVFSWLDDNLRTPGFAIDELAEPVAEVATSLSAYDSDTKEFRYGWNPETEEFEWSADFDLAAPRVVDRTVEVGKRITEPAETGAADTASYLAGHLNLEIGTSYNPNAYLDPFEAGFEAANAGGIIPVNAIPGANKLEVWWYRTSNTNAGYHAGDGELGFKTIYWPSVIGRYTLQWPAEPREIVLASKLGGTGLSTSEALGTIYFRNDPTAHGYNPNEEHAIMAGGTPYATRDDLNQTDPVGYSSDPFVLLEYEADDGRLDMEVFKVLREKPEAGYVFDYLVPAGQLLQPPPPLTFLAKPVEGSGDDAVNYNSEPDRVDGDVPVDWIPTDATRVYPSEGAHYSYGHYAKFTYKDRKDDFWVFRGPHAGLPVLETGAYNPTTDTFDALPAATAVVGEPFSYAVHVSRQDEFLSISLVNGPDWLSASGLKLVGTPASGDEGSETVQVVVRDLYDQSEFTQDLSLTVADSGVTIAQAPLELISTNPDTGSVVTFTTRPPFLGRSPTPANSFTMRYYYRTEPSFAWPGIAAPPPSGSIVPYLRRWDETAERYVGDPADKTTDALDIVYRPFWPVRDPKDSSKSVATLPFGATLAEPGFNLPGVRDFKTARILYQQSIAADFSEKNPSVILHDPTRARDADLTTQFADGKLPGSVRNEHYQGKIFFPDLPPHLVERVFVDPNRGSKGSLGLVGEYKKELLGESYLQLNVLRGSDLQAVIDLCPTGDTANRPKWEALVNALASPLDTFREDLPTNPGTYVPDPAQPFQVTVGNLARIRSDNTAVDSYALSATGPGSGYVVLIEAGGVAFTESGDPVALHVFKVGGSLYSGELKVIPAPNPLSEQISFQHTADLAGRFDEYEYEWKIAAPVDGFPPVIDASMSRYLTLTPVAPDIPRYTLGGAGIQALSDNYVTMRYRPLQSSHPLHAETPSDADWSDWTKPALAEGWIKRVLAGINPFNQRITDLFNNRVNTDVSILTQAGRRWEGDVALNIDTINNYGLIEIYETVLRRGRSLSIESGFNYGPANDALLLAAGYLSDLYMMEGNEAWADAANPTIGIGTADNTYGDIATALFAFKGQEPSLLEEELALLRGRDDVFQPGVEVAPLYNRLVWNYTRGIDSGEVIYALNYNIQENPDQEPDGVINAEDAARMYPQGHGDAYGHYLTALKGYYSLLMNEQFDWVPRIEAVNVLGQPVSVDYQDERKFAAAASAVARAGRQVFDLTWRRDYASVRKVGWEHFSPTRENTQRTYDAAGTDEHPVRHWGLDHWASRTGQGTYLNWVVGNAILPEVDPIPTHEGIQKVDRTTVPELRELVGQLDGLQTAMDNAEGGLSPLGLPEDALAFDINPNDIAGADGGTHFEQIYARARQALNNAVIAFDDAKDVTRLMRSEQDSLADLQNRVVEQELAFRNALIELYGTPYPDDIGPGKTWKQDYAGPDLIHYMYVETPELEFPSLWNYPGEATTTFTIDMTDLPIDWGTNYGYTQLNAAGGGSIASGIDSQLLNEVTGVFIDREPSVGAPESLEFELGPHGFFDKPQGWKGSRASPGRIQDAISAQIAAHYELRQVVYEQGATKASLDRLIGLFDLEIKTYEYLRKKEEITVLADIALEVVTTFGEFIKEVREDAEEEIVIVGQSLTDSLPKSTVIGTASGGDLTFAGRAAIHAAGATLRTVSKTSGLVKSAILKTLTVGVSTAKALSQHYEIEPTERNQALRDRLVEIGNMFEDIQNQLWTINEALRQYDDAKRHYHAVVAEGDRILEEREVFRQRASAMIHGYRTRDAAFRIFRNEKLERYKTLFDLAARYSLLAANAYDYETGLLDTTAGREFIQRIVNARALGVVEDGEPQFAGSNTGDPGLSSALAEMKADWEVLRGRLGFNSPDAYGTTVSLRMEALRILPGADGETHWKDYLQASLHDNILEDADVRRHCMQVGTDDGLPVPGLILTFSTTIADGRNLFGRPLGPGDSAFSPSSFATKIFGVGVALEGYLGMNDPAANSTAVGDAGGDSPGDPATWFLDPLALAATPYIYLIPVGVDSMRSPPLGDSSEIRSWSVNDIAIPMPFNIGASNFSTRELWQSSDSLTEPLFAIRKHQAFRPVSDASLFNPELYGDGGTLQRSVFTNNRLVGRSAWNSQWKIVIPGKTLLNDPDEGLERFIQTVTDLKLHFATYSYSGN